MGRGHPFHLRIAFGVGGVVLADLITGLIAFSVIALGALWFFSYAWLQLAAEYAAHGRAFGTPMQYALAWAGVLADLPLLGAALYFGIRAYQIPRALIGLSRAG
ncbi:MAG: hypothetical protein L3J72_03530 [Thermoplasmata archaeon]|nr:hypothetical protein [Thermoplasmata archaeon]MCI4342486.1 hypothetical protein [Thermoplasmata archaeon]